MKKEEEKSGRIVGLLEISLIVLIILIGGVFIYIKYFYTIECKSFECFMNNMGECKKATYINDEPEASWEYEIMGKDEENCRVDVKLLLAKKGELGIDKVVGYGMRCIYPSGSGVYPEKDLDKCHGRLKEELQRIIIDKLHAYIIENLGKVDEALNKAV